eukprot:NODE_2500_length_469_cov_303.180952_g2062_i0.p1 GENE.NODE_2500_length_469_cov_303.180952_g2062_i0~~NODE_2500_length_469_cov_303.180952_g2062_i0.p1  ORF type:complete len:125 (+),score=1.13 NODE_2500_length_469_cov_303.180952_g2062_i0:68-442(+)
MSLKWFALSAHHGTYHTLDHHLDKVGSNSLALAIISQFSVSLWYRSSTCPPCTLRSQRRVPGGQVEARYHRDTENWEIMAKARLLDPTLSKWWSRVWYVPWWAERANHFKDMYLLRRTVHSQAM